MIGNIFRYFIKRGIIKRSKIEDSFFIYKKLDKKIKLSQEIIKLNYTKESPFLEIETNITSIFEETNLYLWFYKDSESYRYLPESLLLFRYLVKKYDDRIIIFQGNINYVVIIKNGILISSFSKKNIDKNNLLSIKDEYFVEKEIFFLEEEYNVFLEKSYSSLKYNDLFQILNIKLDIKSVLNNIIQWIALPLLFSSLLLTGIIAGYTFYQKNENSKLFENYRSSTKEIREIKDNVNRNEELNRVFLSLKNEFKYIDKSLAMSEIIKISKDLNITLSFIRLEDFRVNFVFFTEKEENVPLFTTKLFESNLFSDIKNISSHRIRNIKTKATMQAKLKER